MESSNGTGTLVTPLAALARSEPGHIAVTYCDDATGERVDVSARALSEWVTATANLLVGPCRITPGGTVTVFLPPHWHTAAVLLGAWSAGMSVDIRLAATAGLSTVTRPDPPPPDAVFAATTRIRDMIERVPEARVRFALDLTADGAPVRDLPQGYLDYVGEVGRCSGLPHPVGTVRTTDAASIDGTSYRQWGAIASEIASAHALHPGDRVLVDLAEREHPLWWLLVPLSARATVILCANLPPGTAQERARAEGAECVL